MRYGVLLLIGLCVSMVSPVRAGEGLRYIHEIESEADEWGDSYHWRLIPFEVEMDFPTLEAEAMALFQFFFDTVSYCMPDGIRVLSVRLEDETLTVNVSDNLLRYGGNAFERALVAQCLATAAGLPYAARLTLMVNGRVQALSEGRIVTDRDLRHP